MHYSLLDCHTTQKLSAFGFRFVFVTSLYGLSIGASLVVAIDAVRKGAASEGMKLRDYIWRGHDPTAVAVMTEVSLSSPFFSMGVVMILVV